eukprot:TRINITY_DN1261_c0_g1_i2.p1 TRINITY_DN1261_c0_g1~~TRINITY_DN1261_c0_g1_i2.p1  ORF type:complete len:166 (-),score=33.99 TRINITY_DN1261_c0_g1_i2:147-644(-)
MNTWENRMTGIGSFASMTLGVLAALNALCGLLLPGPPPTFAISNVAHTPVRLHPYTKTDVCGIQFDLQANLTGTFQWNTKQVFLYVSADFQSNHWNHSIVIWDTIVHSKKEALVNLTGVKSEYDFTDLSSGTMKGKLVTLTVKWMVMPVTGLLFANKGSSISFKV